MTIFETVAWIMGTDLGLVSIAIVFASAWIRVSRIDNLEDSVKDLLKNQSRIDILETKIESIENGINEIKTILNRETR